MWCEVRGCCLNDFNDPWTFLRSSNKHSWMDWSTLFADVYVPETINWDNVGSSHWVKDHFILQPNILKLMTRVCFFPCWRVNVKATSRTLDLVFLKYSLKYLFTPLHQSLLFSDRSINWPCPLDVVWDQKSEPSLSSLPLSSQDDVFQAGGSRSQRLRVRCIRGRTHRYQCPCGGQQAQSEGTQTVGNVFTTSYFTSHYVKNV